METEYIASKLRRLASAISEEEVGEVLARIKNLEFQDDFINMDRDSIRKELEEAEDFTIDKMLEMIKNKEFGFIAIHPRVVGNRVIMELEEAHFGIDFEDYNDLKKYAADEHEAVEYAEKVWKPLIENNFKGMTVVLPKNTSVWYDWNEEDFDTMK